MFAHLHRCDPRCLPFYGQLAGPLPCTCVKTLVSPRKSGGKRPSLSLEMSQEREEQAFGKKSFKKGTTGGSVETQEKEPRADGTVKQQRQPRRDRALETAAARRQRPHKRNHKRHASAQLTQATSVLSRFARSCSALSCSLKNVFCPPLETLLIPLHRQAHPYRSYS